MKQFFFKLIYNKNINRILRNINKKINIFNSKIIEIPPSGILKIKTKENNVLRIKTNQTNYITHLIFWNGYLNFEYSKIFVKLIKKLNSFFDVGANIGYYSLLAALENKKINIVSFEPASGPLFYLKENIRINNFKNIKVESLALSDSNDEITFYESKNIKYKYLKHSLGGTSSTRKNKKLLNFVVNKVQTMTLDNYVKKNYVKKIDLIKLDTEGTENIILSKSVNILKEMKPIIICETLFNKIELELELIMKSYGYQFYNHIGNGLEKVDSIVRQKDNGIKNCFFVHPEKYHLIKEFEK